MEEEIEQTDGYNVIKLDEGAFGRVYQGRKNNEKIIIKILKNQSYDKSILQEERLRFFRNLDMKIQLVCQKFENNQNAQQQLQVICQYDDGSVQEMIGIKTEYAEKGSLANYFIPFSEEVCRYLFKQLLNGLNHLVENRICHRDIKPGNLVLDSQYTLKIIDFGLARENKSLQNNCGTISYKAPEVGVQGRFYDGEKVDVFSAGVILFELYTGLLPFPGAHNYQSMSERQNFILLLNNQYDQFWEEIRQQTNINFSNDFMSLINGMLNPNPHQRFTVQQCQIHQWVNGPVPLPQMVQQYLKNKYHQRNQSEQWDQKKIVQMRCHRKGVSEENLNYMKKQHKLNFENLKIKTDSLENILNYHISIVDPEILILELLYKLRSSYNPGIQIEFEKLSKKTYSIVFNLEINYNKIGKIQIDLYKLENDLIRVNIIKLEGDFEDYLEAKQKLEKLLKEIG